MAESIIVGPGADGETPVATEGRLAPAGVYAGKSPIERAPVNQPVADDQMNAPLPAAPTEAQLQRAQMDPRYKTDAGFRAQVVAAYRNLGKPEQRPGELMQHEEGQVDQADEGEAEQHDQQQIAEALEEAEGLSDDDQADWQHTLDQMAEVLEGAEGAGAALDAMVDGSFDHAAVEQLGENAQAVYEAGEAFLGRSIITIGNELGMSAEQIVEAGKFIDGNESTRGDLYKAALRGDFNLLGSALKNYRDSKR